MNNKLWTMMLQQELDIIYDQTNKDRKMLKRIFVHHSTERYLAVELRDYFTHSNPVLCNIDISDTVHCCDKIHKAIYELLANQK